MARPVVLMLGSVVRHPQQGRGKVVRLSGETVSISFDDGQEHAFTASEVRSWSAPPPMPDLAQLLSAKAASAAQQGGKRVDPEDRRPCRSCGKALNRGVFDVSKALKSCPSCSAKNRKSNEHVFHPFPSGFAPSAKGDGKQNLCAACQAGQGPAKGMECSAVDLG